jgi:hypothetical protein
MVGVIVSPIGEKLVYVGWPNLPHEKVEKSAFQHYKRGESSFGNGPSELINSWAANPIGSECKSHQSKRSSANTSV